MKAPPLDWLRQSVWAGEELPEELALLEAIEPAPELVKKPATQLRAKPKKK